ncbi:MAG: YgiT-type zinc finger protein [candidate division NC10 bacterium]|nr:YgiT-type zinc finger protein [candidate division NC10 bacterium]
MEILHDSRGCQSGRIHFENVPLGVCTQCGEKFVGPEVAKAIDQVLREKKKPTTMVQVPVYQYEADVV